MENDSSDRHFDSHFGLLQHIYLPSTEAKENIQMYSASGGSGGQGDNEAAAQFQQQFDKYEPKVRMYHSYFLATILNFRSMGHACCDACLIIISLLFFFGGMSALVEKQVIGDYHVTWARGKDEFVWG